MFPAILNMTKAWVARKRKGEAQLGDMTGGFQVVMSKGINFRTNGIQLWTAAAK
jgi:hypothetical protein